MMNGPEKSDPVIVATKLANKAERPSAERSVGKPDAAEPVERRAGTKGNAGQQSTRQPLELALDMALSHLGRFAE
jgi:RNA-directed DNA polymerase